MSTIYSERIIELGKRPLNYGTLTPSDFSYEEDNPLCGDIIRIDIQLDEQNNVAHIAWSGEGCTICKASASLLTEAVKGKSIAKLQAFAKEQLLDLLGVPIRKSRLKCAFLSLNVLQKAIST